MNVMEPITTEAEQLMNNPIPITLGLTLIAAGVNIFLARTIRRQHDAVRENQPPDSLIPVEYLAALSWLLTCILGVVSGFLLLNKPLRVLLSAKTTWMILSTIGVMAVGFPNTIKKIIGLPRDHALLPLVYIILYALLVGVILLLGSQNG